MGHFKVELDNIFKLSHSNFFDQSVKMLLFFADTLNPSSHNPLYESSRV